MTIKCNGLTTSTVAVSPTLYCGTARVRAALVADGRSKQKKMARHSALTVHIEIGNSDLMAHTDNGARRWKQARNEKALKKCSDSYLCSAPAWSGRRDVNEHRDDQSDNRDGAPLPSKPVLNCRIPEQGQRQKQETEDRQNGTVEHAVKPRGQQPQNQNDHPRHDQRE